VIVLERMRPVHVPMILEHEHEAFGSESWSAGMYLDELSDVWNRHYVVAFERPDSDPENAGSPNEVLVGWAGLMVISGTAEILTIGTVAAARRRGVATVLMDALLAEARRRRSREVLLEVRIDNEPAKALYARYGFKQMGIRRGYYQPANVDAATLRLAL
jgi:ribosomal-protein-alanine N-acetyltransferase